MKKRKKTKCDFKTLTKIGSIVESFSFFAGILARIILFFCFFLLLAFLIITYMSEGFINFVNVLTHPIAIVIYIAIFTVPAFIFISEEIHVKSKRKSK